MFIERDVNSPKKSGTIEIVSGSKFSGKTEELIHRLKRGRSARKKIKIYKPAFEKRYSESEVISHNENSIRSSPVENSSNILLLSEGHKKTRPIIPNKKTKAR